MKNLNKNILKGTGLALASTAMTGCVTGTNSVKIAEANFDETKEVLNEKIEKNTSVSNKNHTIKFSEGFYIPSSGFKVDTKDLLPKVFKENIVINYPQGISMEEILDLINNSFDVKVNITQTAATYLVKPSALYNENNISQNASSGSQEEAPGTTTSQASDSTELASGGAGGPMGGAMSGGSGIDMEGLDGLFAEQAAGGVMPTEIPSIVSSADMMSQIDESEYRHGMDSRTNAKFMLGDFYIDMNHDGSLRELLDKVTETVDLNWKYKDGKVVIYRWDTKTFIIDQLIGDSEYSASIHTQGATDSSTQSGTTSQLTSFSSSPKAAFVSTQEAIQGILGETEGTLTVSEQTGSFTVTSTPEVLEKVSEYVEEINEIISQKIMLRTDIIEVKYEDTQDLGMDINALYSGSSKLGFALNGSVAGGDLSFGLIDPNNNWTGSEAFINALNKNYETSVVNSTTSTTTNGVPVPIQILNNKTYLKSASAETDENGNQTWTLEPDTLNTGLNMSILPKMLSNGDVMMNLSIDLSSLNTIQEYSTGSASIQMPDTEQRSFMQRLSVKAGQTFLVTGFEKEEDEAKYDSLAGKDVWALGGKKQGGSKRTKTIILITPYTLQR